jgi:hypothetical protein
MESQALRLLLRAKLADGRLPHDHIPRIWSGPGNNESCDACEETISKAQMIMEGIGLDGRGVQFHVVCFPLWDAERKVADMSLAIPANSLSDGEY